jgi:hypothetical protein
MMTIVDPRTGKVIDEDRRFWAADPCPNTFPSSTGVPTVCARHWCEETKAGPTVCCYCEQERADAQAPVPSPLMVKD